jgi:hypothetical protein
VHNLPKITTGHTGSIHSSESAPPGYSRRAHRTELQRLQDQLTLWQEQTGRGPNREHAIVFDQDSLGDLLLGILSSAAHYGIDAERLTGLAWAAFDSGRREAASTAPAASTTEQPASSGSASPPRSHLRSATSGPAEAAADE